jgi:hypothetical protein
LRISRASTSSAPQPGQNRAPASASVPQLGQPTNAAIAMMKLSFPRDAGCWRRQPVASSRIYLPVSTPISQFLTEILL